MPVGQANELTNCRRELCVGHVMIVGSIFSSSLSSVKPINVFQVIFALMTSFGTRAGLLTLQPIHIAANNSFKYTKTIKKKKKKGKRRFEHTSVQ